MTPATTQMDAIPWSRLRRGIHDPQVLPIIGPGLVTVTANGRQLPVTDRLAPQFAQRRGLPVADQPTRNRAACAHLVTRGPRKAIHEELRELVERHANLPLPPGLAELAAIRDFDLFLTATFDGFLVRALQDARPGFPARRLPAFHPHKLADLPESLPKTFLYHVLGAYDTHPDFAVWEEDYLEFLGGRPRATPTCRRCAWGPCWRRKRRPRPTAASRSNGCC